MGRTWCSCKSWDRKHSLFLNKPESWLQLADRLKDIKWKFALVRHLRLYATPAICWYKTPLTSLSRFPICLLYRETFSHNIFFSHSVSSPAVCNCSLSHLKCVAVVHGITNECVIIAVVCCELLNYSNLSQWSYDLSLCKSRPGFGALHHLRLCTGCKTFGFCYRVFSISKRVHLTTINLVCKKKSKQ